MPQIRSQEVIVNSTVAKLIILFILLFLVTSLSVSVFAEAAQESNSTNPGSRQRASTNTIFAEYFTTGWCQYCPSSSNQLKSIYNSNDYDFYFVSMIIEDENSNLISQDAQDRANEFSISSYPTVEFEGGYYEIIGGQSEDSNYREAIETCDDRVKPDIDVKLTAEYKGEAVIGINVDIINNGAEDYSGTLRVYVAEIVSRYLDYDGNHSSYGFIEFAIKKDMSISSSQTKSENIAWDGAEVEDGLGNNFADIDPENMVLYATMSNGNRATAIERRQQSSKALNLYFIDDAAVAYLSDDPPDQDTNPPVVDIFEPDNQDQVSGTIKISATITDERSIIKAECLIDDTNVWTPMYPEATADDEYYRFWDTEYIPDGDHTITVRAVDPGNNVGIDTISVVVANDQDSPVIRPSIKDGQEVSDTFTLKVEVTDDTGIKEVRFQIDDSAWEEIGFDGFNKYSIDIDTTELDDGEHEISIEAEDKAGKISTKSITIQVNNGGSESSKPPGGPIPAFEATLLITLIIIYLIIFVINRKEYFRKK